MTAAEKRNQFLPRLMSLIDKRAEGTQRGRDYDDVLDCLTFTDDAPEPATDWRDEVVSWGTGWSKGDFGKALRSVSGTIYMVDDEGAVLIKDDIWGQAVCIQVANNDPISRCRLIDQFIAGLEGTK